eukprot:555486-Pyramimonas_sp.AAC.1
MTAESCPLRAFSRRSKMLTQRHRSATNLEMTAGGSCLGSPTSTRWPPLRTRLTRDMVECS